MIGLMFFGAIALWGLIAIGVGLGLTKLVREDWRGFAALVFIPLVFFAPVADEIIAYPQMKALCQSGGYELAMTEKDAYGRTIYNASYKVPAGLWPPTIDAFRMKINYVDATSKQSVIVGYGYVESRRGFLGIPAGSSGDKMTAILGKCGLSNVESRDQRGIPTRFSHLNFNVIQAP